jgi:hypothetical protein
MQYPQYPPRQEFSCRGFLLPSGPAVTFQPQRYSLRVAANKLSPCGRQLPASFL